MSLIAESGSASDTATITDTVVAAATVAAAVVAIIAVVVSIWAANKAARQAESAERSAEAAAADQVLVAKAQLALDESTFETKIRPLIVDAPFRRDSLQPAPQDADTNVWWSIPLDVEGVGGAGTFGVEVEVRNVGGAVAFIQEVSIYTGAFYNAQLDRKVIQAGETARLEYVRPDIEFDESNQFDKAIKDGTAYIAILYTDLPGRQRLASMIYIVDEKAVRLTPLRDKRQQLTVSKVEVFQCDENWKVADRPFATTEWGN